MPIYCVVMSDVKQESLANDKVRKQAATVHVWRPIAKKSTANQRKKHNVDLKSIHPVAKDEGIATLFLMHRA